MKALNQLKRLSHFVNDAVWQLTEKDRKRK